MGSYDAEAAAARAGVSAAEIERLSGLGVFDGEDWLFQSTFNSAGCTASSTSQHAALWLSLIGKSSGSTLLFRCLNRHLSRKLHADPSIRKSGGCPG